LDGTFSLLPSRKGWPLGGSLGNANNEINTFLTHLAAEGNVAAKPQNQVSAVTTSQSEKEGTTNWH
jgi:hypothetical protein